MAMLKMHAHMYLHASNPIRSELINSNNCMVHNYIILCKWTALKLMIPIFVPHHNKFKDYLLYT